MHTSNGSALSTRKSASTLRPRTRRLISVEDDLYATDDSGPASRAASRPTSRTPSRPASPAPPPISAFLQSAGAQASRATRDTSTTLSGLWGTSWSAVQGLAANVLGNETTAPPRRRKPLHSQSHVRRTSTSAPPPKQWGPAGSGSHVGSGPQEERDALVRAMKRKDLLSADDHLRPDALGRLKRRNSDERLTSSAPPGEHDDRDALIYIHHVRKQDTLAGVCIKYNCEQAVLRKANRMWPNDTILAKETIVLPVDACGVKGRPVQGPDALPDEDLLLGEYADTASSSKSNPNTAGLPDGWDTPKQKDAPPAATSSAADEKPWKHDSWVLLPNDKTPTEIGRMPRRALGFFPPARRKSIPYSEVSTPRASVELSRSSTQTSAHASSPSQPIRPRASSNLSTASAHSRQRSTSGKGWLQGPGGVGTMGRNVRSPGPAQDGLNKMFAAHLPSVAPPPGQEYFTPWAPSLLDAGPGTSSQHGGSGAVTPLGPGMDLQEIGGAIEGWVRKVGSQAQKMLSEPSTPGQGKRSAVPVLGAVGGDLSDLIELRDDAFEIGDGEDDRGRPGVPAVQVQGPKQSEYQSPRPEFNLAIRDRGRKSAGASSKNN